MSGGETRGLYREQQRDSEVCPKLYLYKVFGTCLVQIRALCLRSSAVEMKSLMAFVRSGPTYKRAWLKKHE